VVALNFELEHTLNCTVRVQMTIRHRVRLQLNGVLPGTRTYYPRHHKVQSRHYQWHMLLSQLDLESELLDLFRIPEKETRQIPFETESTELGGIALGCVC
jgi:hypothetical protein